MGGTPSDEYLERKIAEEDAERRKIMEQIIVTKEKDRVNNLENDIVIPSKISHSDDPLEIKIDCGSNRAYLLPTLLNEIRDKIKEHQRPCNFEPKEDNTESLHVHYKYDNSGMHLEFHYNNKEGNKK